MLTNIYYKNTLYSYKVLNYLNVLKKTCVLCMVYLGHCIGLYTQSQYTVFEQMFSYLCYIVCSRCKRHYCQSRSLVWFWRTVIAIAPPATVLTGGIAHFVSRAGSRNGMLKQVKHSILLYDGLPLGRKHAGDMRSWWTDIRISWDQ